MLLPSLLLGKIVGFYMLIVGCSLLLRQRMWIRVVHDVTKSRYVMVIVGMVELFIGIVIVSLHSMWMWEWVVLITLIGWLMVIEGTAYLFLPGHILRTNIRAINTPQWYVLGGICAIGIGAYLIYMSFGLALLT